MFKIESMPAKICLGISAFLLFLYSVSFMFFATEYVTGGDTGFALLTNGLAGVASDPAYGHGGIGDRIQRRLILRHFHFYHADYV